MKKQIIILLLAAASTLAACTEERIDGRDDQLLGLGGDNYVPTEVDYWLTDHYVVPYNMDIKYRWDRSELSLNATLIPIREDAVVPIMKAIHRGWIVPCEQVAPKAYIQKLSPKRFVLVGSPKYSGNTIVLGEAEGGRKVVIYRLNWYNPQADNTDLFRSIIKTCHHEFVHTIHQAVKYPEEYENITQSGYAAQWTSLTEKESIRRGFVSRYAAASPNEDFSDMLAYLCVNGRKWFDERVAQAAAYYADPIERATMSYDPAAALRSKEEMLINYMKNVWKVNLYDQIEVEPGQEMPDSEKGLVTRTLEAIADLQANGVDCDDAYVNN